MYLAINKRTWTAERRKRHGLQDNDDCALCGQAPEQIDHLLSSCPMAHEIWWLILSSLRLQNRFSMEERSIAEAWRELRAGLPRKPQKGFDSIFLLTSWHICKERNNRIFNGQSANPTPVAERIKEEAKLWEKAGARHISCFRTGE